MPVMSVLNKASQVGKTRYPVIDRMCSKRRIRAPSVWRACCYRVSNRSQAPCIANARRFRTTSTLARVSLPWPNECSRW